jgi:hypothetical protein
MRLLSQALPVKRGSSSKATAIGTYPMESPTPEPNTTSAASPSERRRCGTAASTPGFSTKCKWWQTDDLWYWSLEALAVYVRAAADSSDLSVEAICDRIASKRGITAAGNDKRLRVPPIAVSRASPVAASPSAPPELAEMPVDRCAPREPSTSFWGGRSGRPPPRSMPGAHCDCPGRASSDARPLAPIAVMACRAAGRGVEVAAGDAVDQPAGPGRACLDVSRPDVSSTSPRRRVSARRSP